MNVSSSYSLNWPGKLLVGEVSDWPALIMCSPYLIRLALYSIRNNTMLLNPGFLDPSYTYHHLTLWWSFQAALHCPKEIQEIEQRACVCETLSFISGNLLAQSIDRPAHLIIEPMPQSQAFLGVILTHGIPRTILSVIPHYERHYFVASSFERP